MATDKGVQVSLNAQVQPVSESPDIMTVEDYARVSQVNAILLAGFKAALKSLNGNPWRTRQEWKTALDTFANAPA